MISSQRAQRSRRGAHETVGPYILGKTLGVGTSGKVKAAIHQDTGLQVAVKIIQKGFVQKHKNKIAREVAVMRLVEHPHVLKLYDVFETKGHYFLVMELVRGGELFDYIIKRGKLPRREALRILAQCVQGLEFCHMHSICHRDLKPENLLLDDNLNVKIADFGMAQVIPDGSTLATFCGSPHYGAPEVVSGVKYDGRRSDVWSLGVVFYALVTGMLPFDHKNLNELLKMVKRGRYMIPSNVDADIQDLLRKMLCIDVNERIRTEDIKYHHVFYDSECKVNLFFPTEPQASPALEMMKSNPVTCEADIDHSILMDLEGLGWGDAEHLKHKLLHNRTDSLHNLEYVFYQLIASRNAQRALNRSFSSNSSLEEGAVAKVSFVDPLSPNTPRTRMINARASHGVVTTPKSTRGPARQKGFAAEVQTPPPRTRRASVQSPVNNMQPRNLFNDHNREGEVSLDELPQQPETKIPTMVRKRKKNLRISTARSVQQPPQVERTPRFHRLKYNNVASPDSANGPITPSAKRSWFRNLFRRRPSVQDTKTTDSIPEQPVGGLYSGKTATQLSEEAQKLLRGMGVDLSATSLQNGFDLQCSARCVASTSNGVLVVDGQDNAVTSSERKTDRLEGAAVENIQFRVVVGQCEPNVSSIDIRHVAGDMNSFRGLYNDITRLIEL